MDLIKLLFILFVLLQVADAATTVVALDKGAKEANPLMNWLFNKLGIAPAFMITKGVVIVLLWYFAEGVAIWMWLGLIAIYTWVIYNNLGVIEKLQKKPE